MKKPDPIRIRCGKLGGRPRRYDLAGLKIGQSMTLPWRIDFDGKHAINQEGVHQGVRREERRLHQKFARIARPKGLIVTRVA